MSGESLDDIAKEGGLQITPHGGEQQDQPGQGRPGQDQPGQDQPGEQPDKPQIDRKQLLTKPCAVAWAGGCGMAAWATEVEELKAGDQEAALAGAALADILDVIMPDTWLTDMNPDGNVARVLASGAVLVMIVNGKRQVYAEAVAKREAEQEQQEGSDGAKPEPATA